MISTATLATPNNMRRFEKVNPGRDLPDGGYVRGRSCFAYSPGTGEEWSATSGDYFMLGGDECLTDSEGEPMVLAVRIVHYADALNDELL